MVYFDKCKIYRNFGPTICYSISSQAHTLERHATIPKYGARKTLIFKNYRNCTDFALAHLKSNFLEKYELGGGDN